MPSEGFVRAVVGDRSPATSTVVVTCSVGDNRSLHSSENRQCFIITIDEGIVESRVYPLGNRELLTR